MALKGEAAYVKWVETIYVLFWTDHIDDLLLLQVHRQRQLDKHTANLWIVLQLADFLHEFVFCGV